MFNVAIENLNLNLNYEEQSVIESYNSIVKFIQQNSYDVEICRKIINRSNCKVKMSEYTSKIEELELYRTELVEELYSLEKLMKDMKIENKEDNYDEDEENEEF